ncbi:hypothetical protein HDZ31DRAFT_45555 [Schizophyllum fasciatum]
MASERPPKRVRESESPSIHAAEHHVTHWYRDGSIVLQVQDVLFRVHQTTLEKHSEVFRDLLSVPQMPDEQQVEGCPFVHLEGDIAFDWTYLLDAIYDPLHLDALASQSLSDQLPRLSSILRLSTKYRIAAFRKKCIALLSVHCQTGDTFVNPVNPTRIRHASDLINLARETNAKTLLPFAFLLLVSSESDETIYHAPITESDKLVAYRGMLRLLRARTNDFLPFVPTFDPPANCQAGRACSIGAKILKKLREHPSSALFFGPGDFSKYWPACKVCQEYMRTTYESGRQRTWERLPEIFGLGKDWDELRRVEAYDYSDS